MLGHDAVTEFVEENRSEEEETGQDADGPMLRVRPKRMQLLELRGDDVGDSRKNKDPSRMEVEEFSESPSTSIRLGSLFLRLSPTSSPRSSSSCIRFGRTRSIGPSAS